jgi:hypothetical protein
MDKKFKLKLEDKLIEFDLLTDWSRDLGISKLEEIYTKTILHTDKTIAWYLSYRNRKGWWSKAIRLVSILCFISSTLVPYFAFVNKTETDILYLGYVLAGIGGGLLLFDKYYGFSTSWIRFVLVGKDLENQRNIFVQTYQMHYLKNLPITIESFCNLIDILLAFQKIFNDTIKAETGEWAREFQQNFKELISALKTQSDKLSNDLQERMAANEQTKETGQPKDLPLSVIEEAKKRRYDIWKSSFKVESIAVGKKLVSGNMKQIDCLVFMPVAKLNQDEKQFQAIPEFISYTALDGKTYEIPTDVRPVGSKIMAGAAVASAACDIDPIKKPGCSISRIDNEGTGTLGLKVYRGKKAFLLGCYHVFCSNELKANILEFESEHSVGSARIVSPGFSDLPNGRDLGWVDKGLLNNELDCAIAELQDPDSVVDRFCSIDVEPGVPVTVISDHASLRAPVVSVGRTSGVVRGRIQYYSADCEINYAIAGAWKSKTLTGIIISDQSTSAGDSGAAVLDENNNVLGMVIASSKQFTYILPIQRILSNLSVTLKTNI